MNLALASVSNNLVQVDHTLNPEGRELRGAPNSWLLHVLVKRTDMWLPIYDGQLMTTVPGLCFP